jgi:hypothetical protein
VGEWLRTRYGVPPEESWQSGYRHLLLGDGKGSDEAGYDFQIVTGDRTFLFEVKSSIGDAREFTLAESEVRRAQDLAADEEYMILFVEHVLDRDLRRVIALPNPYAPRGLRHYALLGTAARLRFELAGS